MDFWIPDSLTSRTYGKVELLIRHISGGGMLRSGGAGFMAWLDLAEGSIYGALCFPLYLQPDSAGTQLGQTRGY